MRNSFLMAASVAYLLGSIPFGYILLRVFRGTDVRTSGSGNIGATNVARSSPSLGLATLLLDAGKGFLAVKLVGSFETEWTALAQPLYSTLAVAAFFVVLGHMFPVWLKFRGGKGVATGVGAFLCLSPLAVAFSAVLFLLVVIITRYVSLGSITATAAMPLFVWLIAYFKLSIEFVPALTASIIGGALIIFMHRANIVRLLNGTENRFR